MHSVPYSLTLTLTPSPPPVDWVYSKEHISLVEQTATPDRLKKVH